MKLSKRTGLGTLECVGGETFNCGGLTPAKLANKPIPWTYPADSTIDPMSPGGKKADYKNVDGVSMPYSVLWLGRHGVFFHEWRSLPGIEGCIHLLEGDAKKFYDWANEKIRIVFEWTE